MKLLLGGSPCTHWSIAKTKGRETEPSGVGWELFKNYLIAREKYQPDYFLYENNRSMAPAIREQITHELGVAPILINSALVSAQNRQRLYWTNIPDVAQPEDLGILLRDILESGLPLREKGYALKASYYKSSAVNAVDGGHFPAPMAAEPVNITVDGKAQCLRATYYKDGIRNLVGNTVDRKTCVAEPVRIGTIESDAKNESFDSQQYRVYSSDGKSVTICGQGGGVGAKTGLYAVPCDCDVVITENSIRCQRRDKKHSSVQGSHVNFESGKSQTISVAHTPKVIVAWDGKTYPVYEVRNGVINIKGGGLPDSVSGWILHHQKADCDRVQTSPDRAGQLYLPRQQYAGLQDARQRLDGGRDRAYSLLLSRHCIEARGGAVHV